MLLRLLTIETSKEPWLSECEAVYTKKINGFIAFDILKIKNKSQSRDNSELKKKSDSLVLLERIEDNDFVILMDEKGKNLSSIEFSKMLSQEIESSRPRILIVVGGAYGCSEDLKKRANRTLCLSPLTLSHLTAQAVVLEQIYRSLTIWRRIPYHNE